MDYDDVIVGGGSAGIALAARLSEDPERQVLLVEAGPDQAGVTDRDRLGDQWRFSSALDEWRLEATFVPGTGADTGAETGTGTTVNYPQGRQMGGGSAVNGAFAVRGLRQDYERWAEAGGEAWSWPHMLRVLCRLESDRDFTGDHHGQDGPIPVVRWRRDELLPVQEAFLESVTKQGLPWVDDLNAPDSAGIGAMPMNRQDGLRMSTALTYLPTARDRDNLTIRAGTQVTRVVVEGGRAVGIECEGAGGREQVRGRRIVLSAGAIQSPLLLLRSGIGPADHLAGVGVACTVDLPGVGGNLVDHVGTAVFLVPRDDLDAPDDRVCQLAARFTSSEGSAPDDMWMSQWSSWGLDAFPDLRAGLGVPAVSAVIVGVHDPHSRGSVRLRSADPDDPPLVDFRMLTEPADLSRLVEGLQLAVEVASGPAYTAAYRGIGLLDPGAAGDRAALEAYARGAAGGWYHPVGTCRMGTDPDGGAVVDGHLRVHGVEALHVVDASVMPTVTRSPTNLSSIAIGERAAELLR